MADLEKFRSDTRSWLEANAPKSLSEASGDAVEEVWGGKKAVYRNPDYKRWLDMMAEKGWTSPTWPTEYGGGGLSSQEAKVLAQEMGRLKLPPPLVGFGLTMIGPTLLQFGTEAQRKEHLPRICRGEIRWCQGYSEPDAGSDLAALQCKAEDDGDHFRITGTKVWTSYADESDWIFTLVRSDPNVKKQAGITFILIDMDSPGVTVRPIQLISGASPFCETYFENVRVPKANVLGKINGGWTVAKALLGHERNMIAGMGGGGGVGRRRSLAEHARRYLAEVDGKLADPLFRDQIARLELDARAFGLTVQRTSDSAKAGHKPGPESSLFKVYGTELNMRRQELMVQIAGPQALGWEGDGFEDDELVLTRNWLRSRGNAIEGGTSEIQRNIIAKRVLGLPD
jgi:alkylation response protein AidB-like acyl-CoA dehydrogenase